MNDCMYALQYVCVCMYVWIHFDAAVYVLCIPVFRAKWCVTAPFLCPCLITRARTVVAEILSVFLPHTHPMYAWTHNQVLTHNLDLFLQKLKVMVGIKGRQRRQTAMARRMWCWIWDKMWSSNRGTNEDAEGTDRWKLWEWKYFKNSKTFCIVQIG